MNIQLEKIGDTSFDGDTKFEVVDLWIPMPHYLAKTIERRDTNTDELLGRFTMLKKESGKWFPA